MKTLHALARAPFFFLLLFVLVLPFEWWPSWEVWGISLRANQAALATTLLVLLTARLIFRRGSFILPAFGLPLALFFTALAFSATFSEWPGRTWLVFLFTLFTALAALLIPELVRTGERLRLLLAALFSITALAVFFSFFQFTGDMAGLPKNITLIREGYGREVFGFPRIHAFSLEPLYFANFLLIPIGIGLALYLKGEQRIFSGPLRRSFGFVLLASLLAFGLTASRGGFAGLAALLATLFILLPFTVARPINFIRWFPISLLLLLGFSLILIFAGPRAIDRFLAHVTLREAAQTESTVARLRATKDALSLWRDRPLFGIGPGAFGPALAGYSPEPPAGGWPIVNNEYVELLAETGIVGLAAFALFLLPLLGRSFLAIFKTKDSFLRTTNIGLLASLVGVLVQYTFFSTLYILHIWFLFGLTIAAQNLALRGEG